MAYSPTDIHISGGFPEEANRLVEITSSNSILTEKILLCYSIVLCLENLKFTEMY